LALLAFFGFFPALAVAVFLLTTSDAFSADFAVGLIAISSTAVKELVEPNDLTPAWAALELGLALELLREREDDFLELEPLPGP
jgi:hypothetical protein